YNADGEGGAMHPNTRLSLLAVQVGPVRQRGGGLRAPRRARGGRRVYPRTRSARAVLEGCAGGGKLSVPPVDRVLVPAVDPRASGSTGSACGGAATSICVTGASKLVDSRRMFQS